MGLDLKPRFISNRSTTQTATMIYDIAIIGAGPAGAMAARKLEELGIDHVLLDRAEFPRNKPCAGVLSPKIHSLIDIPDEVIERKLEGYRVFGPPDAVVESPIAVENPPDAVVNIPIAAEAPPDAGTAFRIRRLARVRRSNRGTLAKSP